MENWIIDILQLPATCQAEEVLPKYFMSQNFALTSGESNLMTYSVEDMAIVAALGKDYCDIESSENIEGAVVLVVEMKGGKFAKEASKVAEVLHKYLPQHLIIGMTDGESACLSIAEKIIAEDGAVALEACYTSTVFSPEMMDELASRFSFELAPKHDMKALWTHYCELIETMC